jgi:WD40 repeat protein
LPEKPPIAVARNVEPIFSIGTEDLAQRGDTVEQIAFSPDGNEVAIACSASKGGIGRGAEGGVSIWDIARRKQVASMAGATDQDVNTVGFSPDGKFLAAGDYLGRVILWDRATSRQAGTIDARPHDADEEDGRAGAPVIGSLQFTPDSKSLLVQPPEKGLLPTWDVATRRRTAPWEIPPDLGLAALSLRPDGPAMVLGLVVDAPEPGLFGNEPSKLIFWNLSTKKRVWSRDGLTPAHHVEISTDGRRIAMRKGAWQAGEKRSKEVLLLEPKTGRTAATYRSVEEIDDFELSPDGRFLAIACSSTLSEDGPIRLAELRLVDASTGELVSRTAIKDKIGLSDLTFSRDARLLAAGGFDGRVRVWRVDAILDRRETPR